MSRVTWLLLACRFCTSTSGLLVVPYIAYLLTTTYRLSGIAAAIAGGLVFIGGRVFSYPIGLMADRAGARRMLAGSCCIGAVGTGLLSVPAETATMAVLGVVVLSAASAVIGPVFRSLAARVTGEGAFTTVFSLAAVAAHVGSVCGATTSGVLVTMGHPAVAGMIASALLLVSAVCIHATKRYTPAILARTTPAETVRTEPRARGPLVRSRLRVLAAANALIGYLGVTIYIGLAVYDGRALHNPGFASLFFVMQSIAVLALLPLIGPAIRGFAAVRLFRMHMAGLLLGAVGFVLFGATPAAWPWGATLLLAALFSAGQCLGLPSGDALVALSFPARDLGRVFGALTTATAIGSGIASVATGIALDSLSPDRLRLLWLLPGVIAGVGFLLLMKFGSPLFARDEPLSRGDRI